MQRRDLLKGLLAMPLAAAELYAQRTRGLPPLTIKEVRLVTTSPGKLYPWIFVKIITSEPGLYGIGSASHAFQAFAVAESIRKHMAPFWTGKSVDSIEDLWQETNVHSYWRNSTLINNVLSGLDMALWDIKGKRAGMPLYELLGGKVRDAVPCYAHADGRDPKEVEDNVRKYMEEGYRHVRAQMGGYGGGGFVPEGTGSRVTGGYAGPGFDEDIYLETIPKLFAHLRTQLGWNVKLLHDVHEHLTPTVAREFAKQMEPYRLFFVEDILPPEQIDWFRLIRKVTTTPMAMGELFTHPLEWTPLISERLIDFIRCRVSAIGGITPAKKVATLCEAFGVRTAWQEGGDNDPVNQLAAYHLDMSIPSFGIQEENHFPPLVYEMMPGTAEIKGGYLYGNDKPGLGVDIDEEMAKKYPMPDPPTNPNWMGVRQIDGSLVKP